jgi:predicted aconitase
MGNFVLDKKTGTFVPAPSETEEKVKDMAEAGKVDAGEIKDAVDIMNKTTQVKLASDASGLPNEPTETFKRLSDLSVFQVIDQPTGKVLCIISGYALQIKFNREAITSAADVEQCAEGLKKMFYNAIMDQILGDDKK